MKNSKTESIWGHYNESSFSLVVSDTLGSEERGPRI